MTAVAVQDLHERPHLRLLKLAQPQIEPWELNSELALVSPEVRRCALEQLPERRPYAFLVRRQEVAGPVAPVPSQGSAVAGYIFLRLSQTARLGVGCVGALTLLATVADILH